MNRAKSINGFLLFFVFIQLFSCTGSRIFNADDLLLEMEKTACYGQCPVYTIQVDSRGNGLFNGVENTQYTGIYAFRLGKNELEQLRSSFEKAGFFGLEDKYFEFVSDLPTTYLTYRQEGRTKKIMDYYGAPRKLKDLEKYIESLVLSRKMRPMK
jgi:hypothetical protein